MNTNLSSPLYIALVGDMTWELAKEFEIATIPLTESISFSGTILGIYSLGKDIDAAKEIGLIAQQKLPRPLITVNLGYVGSAALIPFSFGKVRYTVSRGTFLFDPLKINEDRDISRTGMNERDLEVVVQRKTTEIINLFSDNTGIPNIEVDYLYHRKKAPLEASEAHRLGIVDRIQDVPMPLGVEWVRVGQVV